MRSPLLGRWNKTFPGQIRKQNKDVPLSSAFACKLYPQNRNSFFRESENRLNSLRVIQLREDEGSEFGLLWCCGHTAKCRALWRSRSIPVADWQGSVTGLCSVPRLHWEMVMICSGMLNYLPSFSTNQWVELSEWNIRVTSEQTILRDLSWVSWNGC